MPGNSFDEETYARICREDLEFFGPPGPGEQHISYRATPEERTFGVDVRFMIKVVSGNHARHLDVIQTQAIMDYLRWCRDYRQQQEQKEHAGPDQEAPPAAPARTRAPRQPDTRRK
jgi:hypothetical protein